MKTQPGSTLMKLPSKIPLLEPASRFHTAMYSVLFSIVTICGAVQMANMLAPILYPEQTSFPVLLAAIVTGCLAPPASFVLGLYSFKLIRIQEKLHSLATTDPLTGLLNRRALENKYLEDIEAAAVSNIKTSLILVDLDGLKAINHRYGHMGGDALICGVADLLDHILQDGDAYVARWGGQEFAIIAPKTGLKKATRMGRVVRSKIEELKIVFGPNDLQTTASIGVIECLTRESLEDGVDRADRCMRKAKSNGRNKVVVFPSAQAGAPTAIPSRSKIAS
ncbi:MAG: GGDEF domain-containing protein [Pseudomonadota bacterium]